MTPTNTQGSEQELRESTKRSIALLVAQRRGADKWDNDDLVTASNILFVCSALIKSDRETYTKKIQAIVEHEYQHTTYSDMNLDSICNYDDAFEQGAEVLNKKISKRLAQLSKEKL